jgi:hypothetical protein
VFAPRIINVGKVNMELQLDATITVLLISKSSSTCFGQAFAHLQERKTKSCAPEDGQKFHIYFTYIDDAGQTQIKFTCAKHRRQ